MMLFLSFLIIKLNEIHKKNVISQSVISFTAEGHMKASFYVVIMLREYHFCFR